MNSAQLGPLAIQILQILTGTKTDDNRMTSAAIYARCTEAKAQIIVTQTLHNLHGKSAPMVDKQKGVAGTFWSITEAGINRLNGTDAPMSRRKSRAARLETAVAEEATDDADEAVDQPFDVAVWASGDISIMHGETNLLLTADEGTVLLRHLIRCTVPSSHESFATGNKFAAFLDSCAPTEATGLPGVELDGQQGIRIPEFGQRQPAPMTRDEQFAEAAARG